MIILTEKLAIRSDANQWMLCKREKFTKKNPTGWVPFKYYSTLEQAARGAAGLLLRISAYETISELKSNADEIAGLLDIKLKDFKVIHQ